MALQQFLHELENEPNYWKVSSHREVPGTPPVMVPALSAVENDIYELLTNRGIHDLYDHQAEALKHIREGKDVVVATPTASGKSLIYQIAIAETVKKNPCTFALMIFPIKALSRDQLESARLFLAPILRNNGVAVYDGDTPRNERSIIRKNPPTILITNPDMLHYGFLPYHSSWQKLWQGLNFIVIDEMHTYRGVFGSHVALIIRRLLRICRYYGSHPQLILLSATIGNPLELACQLTGRRSEAFSLIEKSGAPQAKRYLFFLKTDYPLSFTGTMIAAKAMKHGLKTIVFTRSRRMTELIYKSLKDRFPAIARYVSSYRAGLLPEDRREIEQALAGGKLRGVIATSALELGVDIGNLDVCVLVGYPGTVMATWQRAGRVGRGGQESAVVLLPQSDALDQYIVNHPEHILQQGFESAVAYHANPEVLKAHLPCAAAEIPITIDDLSNHPEWCRTLEQLTDVGRLQKSGENGLWYASSRYPHREVDIRQVGKSYTILLKMKESKPTPVGSVDGMRVFKECHPGAVYLHLGDTYTVEELDTERQNVLIVPFSGPYFTMVSTEKETEILEVLGSRTVRNFAVRLGRLKVTERVLGYEKKSTRSMESLDFVSLNLPPLQYETVGLWLEIDEWIRDRVKARKRHYMGGLHALEHAIISMFPLFLLCDRNDIGGIAQPLHPQVRKSAIFIYDGYPGGIGLCAKGFERIENILEKVRELLMTCDCVDGCPQCIHSPKCGSGNRPLDKESALIIVESLIASKSSKVAAEDFPKIPTPIVKPESNLIEKYHIAFLDLETQKLAQEVGGWSNKHLMRVSVVVLYDNHRKKYIIFKESAVGKLLKFLKTYDLIVGFNIKKFDYKVLAPYTPDDLSTLPTFDILEEIRKSTGFRVSLDNLASTTLGGKKMAEGIQAVHWFRNGEWKKLVNYCKTDVRLTRDLFFFAIRNGYLKARDKNGKEFRIATPWDLEEIIRTGSKKVFKVGMGG